jgi:MFS transporter, UMF1 family
MMKRHPSDAPPVPRREIFAWAGFDFANSAFTTVMVTVLFPTYFITVLCGGAPEAERWWGWAGGAANLMVVLLGPLLGAYADRGANKKRFLLATTLGCVTATAVLGFIAPGQIVWAWLLFVVANFCFALGENFCASFLPEISTPATAGRISALGWSVGYFGGLASLLLARTVPVPQGILLTALFFGLAALPTFLFLRERASPQLRMPLPRLQEWIATLRDHRNLARFLLCFFFASAGLSTVIYFAGIFATRELGMNTDQLVIMFLALQLSAAAGAWGFGGLQDKMGSRLALGLTFLVWVVVIVGCVLTRDIQVFYLFAALAGVGLGATQTCARAFVSQLTPPARSAEFFGLWGVCGKLAPVLALPVFGELATRFGLRPALLSTLVFFILAGIVLSKVHPLPREKASLHS